MQLATIDIQQFIKNPKSIQHDKLASEVATAFCVGNFTPNEYAIAADIFRLLLRDAEKSIRKTLADTLCHSENAPHDVILRLANDDDNDIAEKVLQHSEVLTDDDLIAIVTSTKEVLNLCAIARRNNVPEQVSDSLLSTRQERVLGELFTNKSAKIGKDSLEKTWDIIAPNGKLMEALVSRGGLPPVIAEKMFMLVSDEIKNHIASEYQLKAPVVQKYIADAREWELLGLLPIYSVRPDDDARVEDLVDHLADTGGLTHSLIIRALCMGCLNLFEAGIARLAGVPRAHARILLMGGNYAFTSLYKAAYMPDIFADGIEKILGIALELSQYGYTKPEDFKKSVVEKIYIARYNQKVEGMTYLLSIIDGKISNSNTKKNEDLEAA